MSDEGKNDFKLDIPVLEEPSVIDQPTAGVGTLLGEDFASATSKLITAETLLKLLVQNLNFHDFMREILLLVMKVVRSEAGSILEIDQEKKTIFFRAAVGHTSDEIVKFIIPLGKGVVGHVAESKQTLVVSDVEGNSIHLKEITKAVGFDAKNLVAVPIIVRGQVYGVLELLNRVGEETYTSQDVELLNAVCEMISKAIEVKLMISWSSKKRAA